MKKDQKMLSTIPFAGFCSTFHEGAIDREVEYEIENFYIETGQEMPQALQSRIWDTADFGSARLDYAKEYAGSFLQWLGLDGCFESMQSPRYYNYETDRIFVELTRDDVARLWRMAPKEKLTEAARDRFTSRSGFISHYSNDWRDWGPISQWDHNQLGTLVLVAAEYEQGGQWGMHSEPELIEGFYCNGGISNALHGNPDYSKATKLSWYLIERTKRKAA